MAEYLVKEIFGPTIQGEGVHAGKSCVFLRFAACNLACTWCDTDFASDGAETLRAAEIVRRLEELDRGSSKMVVVTGGEPALQWDAELAAALREAGFRVHMETNGTRQLAAEVDWLTVSPKPRFHDGRFHLIPSVTLAADECKVVVDDSVGASELDRFRSQYRVEHLLLQPCMGPDYQQSLARCLELVCERPEWRLSLQLHKLIGVP